MTLPKEHTNPPETELNQKEILKIAVKEFKMLILNTSSKTQDSTKNKHKEITKNSGHE